jgi:hypothetical protein
MLRGRSNWRSSAVCCLGVKRPAAHVTRGSEISKSVLLSLCVLLEMQANALQQ